jgi:hypothetical protein
MGCESERGEEAVREVVAICPNLAGVPLVVVQYGRYPAVSFVEVPTVPLLAAFIVTAPVAPEIEIFEPATIEVTPALVTTPLV